MINKSSTAVAALLAAAIGLAGFVPAASAEDPGQPQLEQSGLHHFRMDHRPMRGGLLDLVCSDRGAEELEISFVRLSHRIELTPEQTTLFDDLRTTALAAQTAFADTCTAARGPIVEGGERPNLAERLQTRIAVQTAELDAWNTMLPKLEAFLGGLTAEQKAALEPKRDHRGFFDDRKEGPGLHRRGGPIDQEKPGHV